MIVKSAVVVEVILKNSCSPSGAERFGLYFVVVPPFRSHRLGFMITLTFFNMIDELFLSHAISRYIR
jgi:hypothetical protein